MKVQFCSKCGGSIAEQIIGDRPREVCSACGTIFYQNPLPAAAALVLDNQRQVLLVKRKFEPNKGMWCLPIGFAQITNLLEISRTFDLETQPIEAAARLTRAVIQSVARRDAKFRFVPCSVKQVGRPAWIA